MLAIQQNNRFNSPARWRVLFFCLLISGMSRGQSDFKVNTDSLRLVYQQAKPDQKARACFDLGLHLQAQSMDSLPVYAAYIKTMQERDPTPTLTGYYHELMGTYYGHTRKMEQAIEHFRWSEQAYSKTSLHERRQTVFSNLIFILNHANRPGESMLVLKQAVELGVAIGDTTYVIEMLNQQCMIQAKQKLFTDAIRTAQRANSLVQHIGASPYFTYAGFAKTYEHWPGKLDSALIFYEKALLFAQQERNFRAVAIEQSNLARCYVKANQSEKARPLVIAAIDSLKTRPIEKYSLSKCYLILAEVEYRLGNLRAVLENGDQAAELMKNRKDYLSQSLLYDLRARTYAAMGEYEQAYSASQAWKIANDSVSAHERAGMIADITAQYRSQEQQATIAAQNLQLERTRARNRLYLAGAIIALLAGGAIAFGWRQQRQKTQLELRLQQAEAAQLRDLDRSKSAFFANISHEFRTPLTLILSPLRDLLNGQFKGDLQRTYTIMERNGQRLLGLVNQLLDLSRLESGQLRLNEQDLDLATHLRGVTAAFESLADSRQINYVCEGLNGEIWCSYDRDKLEKIVVNLLSNAFKFTKEEGTIRFSLQQLPNKQVQIQVHDTGIGIPQHDLSRIFDRFYTIENHEADLQAGSGIGLALTKELVTLMQGNIEVASVEHHGTTFIVTLPLPTAVPQASANIALSNLPPATHTDTPPASVLRINKLQSTVLVVEDNPDLSHYLREQLQAQYQVHIAENGRIALDWALEHTPDLVITDLMMPEMDGLQLTEQLKSDLRTNHIPVVMLTAKVERDDRLTGLRKGAEAYLSKPLDSDELRAVVHRLLQQRSMLYEKYSQSIRLGISDLPEALSAEQQWLQTVLQTIEDNMEDEMFGVEQLADKLAMSRSNLFRKLNAITGKNPNTLLRELRLERARQLLEQGAGNVSEIAYRVGFNSRTYFARCYAAQYGVVPSGAGK
jgi:signal transduction histidine kinase/DNA-binding response OmpR family regulator